MQTKARVLLTFQLNFKNLKLKFNFKFISKNFKKCIKIQKEKVSIVPFY